MLRRLIPTLAVSLLLCACSGRVDSGDRRSEFVDKPWVVSESSDVAPGSVYVFESDGTLRMTSPHSTPAVGTWKFDGNILTMVEESIPYNVEILELTPSVFRIKSYNPGGAVEITLIPAPAE